jgi:hypothetical protein
MKDLIKKLDEFREVIDKRDYPVGEEWKFDLETFYYWLKNDIIK